MFCFLFFYYVNIVDVSAMKLIFGHQWVHLMLPQTQSKQKPQALQSFDKSQPSFIGLSLETPFCMPQCQGTINDTCTKGHGHKLLLADWRDIRDRWTQPGENSEESTLINLHRHQGQLPRAILRTDFNLVHKKNGRKRQCCICYLPCTFLSSCLFAVSTLAWKEAIHSPGTKPRSMPTGTGHSSICRFPRAPSSAFLSGCSLSI